MPHYEAGIDAPVIPLAIARSVDLPEGSLDVLAASKRLSEIFTCTVISWRTVHADSQESLDLRTAFSVQ